MDKLASTVAHYRKQGQMSVRDLARKADVSVSYIYAIESGVRGKNITKLEKVAHALGLTLEDLLKGEIS